MSSPDIREALELLRDHGYQPMYNGRPSCPFCERFVDDESGHSEQCILVRALLDQPASKPDDAGLRLAAARDEIERLIERDRQYGGGGSTLHGLRLARNAIDGHTRLRDAAAAAQPELEPGLRLDPPEGYWESPEHFVQTKPGLDPAMDYERRDAMLEVAFRDAAPPQPAVEREGLAEAVAEMFRDPMTGKPTSGWYCTNEIADRLRAALATQPSPERLREAAQRALDWFTLDAAYYFDEYGNNDEPIEQLRAALAASGDQGEER